MNLNRTFFDALRGVRASVKETRFVREMSIKCDALPQSDIIRDREPVTF